MKERTRDRVTIDLRGLGARLQAQASARGMTVAAWTRSAILATLADTTAAGDAPAVQHDPLPDAQAAKVTLRISARHAAQLAARARAADRSHGAYVAGLLDGAPPPPLPADHAQAVTALIASTDQLALISADLNAFMRLLTRGSSPEVERYRAGIVSLAADVRRHLGVAAAAVTELRPGRRHPGSASSKPGRTARTAAGSTAQ